MKRGIWFYIVILELIVIAFGGYNLYQKQDGISGSTIINPIKKDNLVFEKLNGLKYFYEPQANSIIVEGKNLPNSPRHSINSDTLNSIRNYDVEKPLKVFRLITLGDSYTYGMHVNTSDSWPSVLERILNSSSCVKNNKYDVINLGVEGYDSRYEVERMKKRGLKYGPDLVLWLEVDLSRNRELLAPLMKEYKSSMKGKSEKTDIWGMAYNKLIIDYGYSRLIEYNKNAIESMNNYYKGKLVMIAMPVRIRHDQESILKNIVKKNPEWYYFSGLRNIYENGGSFLSDFHPNQKGHEMMAEDVLDYLTKSKLIPCN